MCFSLKNTIADYFGLRVVTRYGLENSDYTFAYTDSENGGKDHTVRFYIVSAQDDYSSGIVKTEVSTPHLVERVTRTACQIFTIFATAGIATLGYFSLINPTSPVFAAIGTVAAITSVALFVTSWYFDKRFREEMEQIGTQLLIKPDRSYYEKMTGAEVRQDVKKAWEEGRLYFVDLDLKNYKEQENRAKYNFANAWKAKATDAYASVVSTFNSYRSRSNSDASHNSS